VLLVSGYFWKKLLLTRNLSFISLPIWAKLIIAFLLLGVNFLIIRGGVGVSTMNQSSAYFSDQLLLNQAAVNTEWNLFKSALSSGNASKNKYLYYSRAEAEQTVKDLYAVEKDTTIRMLSTNKPNVVLFIME